MTGSPWFIYIIVSFANAHPYGTRDKNGIIYHGHNMLWEPNFPSLRLLLFSCYSEMLDFLAMIFIPLNEETKRCCAATEMICTIV